MQLINRKYLTFILVFIPFLGWTQLPKPQILAENRVKSIEIWQHRAEPLVRGEITPQIELKIAQLEKEIPDKRLIKTWFFNEYGYPDSCWRFGPSGKNTMIFGFDAQKRVNFLQHNTDGHVESKEKVERIENGEILGYKWNLETNTWEQEYTLNKDSLFIKTNPVSDTLSYYFDNRTKGVIERSRCVDGKIKHRYTERWTTLLDGTPDSLIISFVQYEKVTRRNGKQKSYVYDFKLNEDGSIVPAHGLVYPNKNYFTRGQKKVPFTDIVKGNLNGDEIITQTEVYVEMTFSNVHPQYYLAYTYEYNLTEK